MLLRIDGLDDRALFKRVRELNQRLHDVRVANLLGQAYALAEGRQNPLSCLLMMKQLFTAGGRKVDWLFIPNAP